MLAAVFIGFARTYYLKGMYGSPTLSPLFHAHGLMFTTWMVLLIAQPLLVAAALYWRRNTSAHKRLMLIATMELIPAGFGRWPMLAPYGPLGFFGSADLFLLAILAYDLTTLRRPHPATVVGGLFLIASQFGRMMIGSTTAWQTFAMWLIS